MRLVQGSRTVLDMAAKLHRMSLVAAKEGPDCAQKIFYPAPTYGELDEEETKQLKKYRKEREAGKKKEASDLIESSRKGAKRAAPTACEQAGRFWRPGEPECSRAVWGRQIGPAAASGQRVCGQDSAGEDPVPVPRMQHHGPLEEGWHVQGGGRGRPHQEKDGRAGQGRQGLQKVESYDNQNFSIAKSPLKMPIERLGSEENNFFIKEKVS